MTENTKIEWADHTFNPWIGCTKVSPGCDHCYAEALSKRAGHSNLWQGARRRTTAAYWRQPLKWNREAAAAGRRDRVFCASMADVFDNQVPDEWRSDLWDLIEETPHLTWMLLTKRIGNAWRMLRTVDWATSTRWNVWLGATVVNQEEADRDIPKLQDIPARVRFLSCEPLLGPLDIAGYLEDDWTGNLLGHCTKHPAVDWVIVGGESGGGARPMHPEWVRGVRDACVSAGVAFFFKQWGEWAPLEVLPDLDGRRLNMQLSPGYTAIRAGKKATGRSLDGRTWDELPNQG